MSAPVAVVIPVWDSYVRWLDEAVRSVVDQKTGAELIVVDNASEVPVPEIPRATVIRANRRLTTGAARNLGLRAVSAPLVVFLDADDVMLPGSLKALVAGIESDAGAVASALGIVDGDTGHRHRSPRLAARFLARWPFALAMANSIWSLLPTQGATIMRTRDALAAGGYADRSQGEDWALAAALAWRGRIHFERTPALIYRWRWDSPGRASASRTLLASARAVRDRLRDDPGLPRSARRMVRVVGVGQWVAITLVRPVFRGLRPLGGGQAGSARRRLRRRARS
jgi:glycosyltransferase involved in cell wall biosynthesis